MGKKRFSRSGGNYKQNHGKPGSVYILENDAFPHLLKIGQTTRTVHTRLNELNEGCGTENPGYFKILYQRQTVDCGRAEELAHDNLKEVRFRKEYFQTDLFTAQYVVDEACAYFDSLAREEERKRNAAKQREERERDAAIRARVAAQMEAERAEREREKRAQLNMLSYSERRERLADSLLAASAKWNEYASKTNERKAAEAKSNKSPVTSRLHADIDRKAAEAQQEIQRLADWKKTVEVHDVSASKQPEPSSIADKSPFVVNDPQGTEYDMASALMPRLFLPLLILFSLLSLSVCSSTRPAPSPHQPVQAQDELSSAIQHYAQNYQYPALQHDDETILRKVSSYGKTLVFNYYITDLGKRVFEKSADENSVKQNMQKTACKKEELRGFIAQGATVIYTLHLNDREAIKTFVSCPAL